MRTPSRLRKLKELEVARLEYKDVKWKSSNGTYVCIYDIDERYLLNIMKTVSSSLLLYNNFPIEEFGCYEGVTYIDWSRYLMTEYKFRAFILELEYMDHVDREIAQQDIIDAEWYKDDY